MKTKKLLSLILAMAMCLGLLSACGSGSSSSSSGTSDSGDSAGSATESEAEEASGSAEAEAEETGEDSGSSANADGDTIVLDGNYLRDKITVSLSSDGGTLDAFTRSQWGSGVALLDLVYQKLAYEDTEGNLRWAIGESFEQVDDLTYTLTIHDDVYDSLGNHITASDIVYSFEYFISLGNTGAINRLDHLEVVDDYTLTWYCSEEFGDGDMVKNLTNCYIVSQEAYESRDMTTDPVGTGPYVVESYTAGSTVILKANEDFWMKDLSEEEQADLWVYCAQNVGEIEYQIIQDSSSRAIALEMGTIDMADSLDIADIDAFEGNDDISTVSLPQTAPVAFIFNCSDDSPCADLALRQAICYALDNEAIADGLAVPATAVTGFQARLYDAPDDWSSGRDYYDYDLDKVTELLEESGYNGETLTLSYSSTTANDGAALIMQSQLAAVGINVELNCLEESVLETERYDSTKWDLRLETFGGGSYMSQVLKTFTTEDAANHLDNGEQLMLIADTTLDDLYNAIVADPSEANAEAWDQYFTYDNCYAYALCVYDNQTAVRSDVNAAQGTKYALMPNASTFND
ncbi:MAG: ABC transporter substrate-binding protein [Clostridiales bacterium]|nr:ABC transporter substrate-binding protein [Clostridiales bacterium]